jgi:hydroxymethylpyrimidine pyrophosphatase-like HAD family hydrolase
MAIPELEQTGLRLIVCDNDGCLLPEEPSSIAFEPLRPIAEYNKSAFTPGSPLPPLTICTGRPAPFVELLLRFLNCLTIPAVCEHGVLTYSLAENHAKRDPSITEAHSRMLQELRTWMRTDHPDWILEAGKEGTVSVYVPGGADHALDTRREEIAAKVIAEGWPMIVGQTVTYVNTTLNHVNKATALQRVFKELSVEPEHVLAIGDTAGDLVMADLCGYFACPANAEPAVRDRADYVSPFEITEGVVDILEQFTGFDPSGA